MRIAVVIAEAMMATVRGDPEEEVALSRHATQDRERNTNGRPRFERTVREKSVKADGDAEAGNHAEQPGDEQCTRCEPVEVSVNARGDTADKRR